jgi:hypothetical protein
MREGLADFLIGIALPQHVAHQLHAILHLAVAAPRHVSARYISSAA